MTDTEGIPANSVDAFKLLFGIENGLRKFLIAKMEAHAGSRWYKSRLPGDVLQKYKDAKKYENTVPWVDLVPHHPIYYLDFPDLRKIIEQTNNWKEIFQPIFQQKSVAVETLFSVEPIRNKTAHNRIISNSDLKQLGLHPVSQTPS
jgi:hypothetical protein